MFNDATAINTYVWMVAKLAGAVTLLWLWVRTLRPYIISQQASDASKRRSFPLVPTLILLFVSASFGWFASMELAYRETPAAPQAQKVTKIQATPQELPPFMPADTPSLDERTKAAKDKAGQENEEAKAKFIENKPGASSSQPASDKP